MDSGIIGIGSSFGSDDGIINSSGTSSSFESRLGPHGNDDRRRGDQLCGGYHRIIVFMTQVELG